MTGFALSLLLNNHAATETLVEQCKAKQKEIVLLEKTGDTGALAQAKEELIALFRQQGEVIQSDYSNHGHLHEVYFTTKTAFQDVKKEIEFFNAEIFKYYMLPLNEQLLLDEIKAFLEAKNIGMNQALRVYYEQWSTNLDSLTAEKFMHVAHEMNNQNALISWYCNALKMVRMQLELLTIDNRSVKTLETPVCQMLRDDELQSVCLKIATQLFKTVRTLWKKTGNDQIHDKFFKQALSRNQVMNMLMLVLPKRFHSAWWQGWIGRTYTARSLVTSDSCSELQSWCDEYLKLSKACAQPQTVADKKVYQETLHALDVLYCTLQTQLEVYDTGNVCPEKLAYQIFVYKVLMMKKDLKKFEHYQYDVAKEGIAARHAVLVEQESFKQIATQSEFSHICDQYIKVVDLYLYNQTKTSLLMFELYKLATHLKMVKEQYKLSKIMWLLSKEHVVCYVIDDMIANLEYIALDVSDSKGFEKNSIIEHILAGAWAAQQGGLMQKKSFFSQMTQKLFGNHETDMKNQIFKALGYAGPVVAGAALKMLMPYISDDSADKKNDTKADVQEDSSKLLERLMSEWDVQKQT